MSPTPADAQGRVPRSLRPLLAVLGASRSRGGAVPQCPLSAARRGKRAGPLKPPCPGTPLLARPETGFPCCGIIQQFHPTSGEGQPLVQRGFRGSPEPSRSVHPGWNIRSSKFSPGGIGARGWAGQCEGPSRRCHRALRRLCLLVLGRELWKRAVVFTRLFVCGVFVSPVATWGRCLCWAAPQAAASPGRVRGRPPGLGSSRTGERGHLSCQGVKTALGMTSKKIK